MPRPEEEKEGEGKKFKKGLYGELVSPETLEKNLKKPKKKKRRLLGGNPYLWLYRVTEKYFIKKKKGIGRIAVLEEPKKGKEIPHEYKEAFDFLGWEIKPEIAMKVPLLAGIMGLLAGITISSILFVALNPSDAFLLLFIMFIPVFLALGTISYFQKYPLNSANAEKMRALSYVPEIINYLVMQMRLQPNLERAVEFAAEHGEGRIANELNELLWKTRIGVYESIEEGLDELAYRWEPYSEEFKHAITMIRASVLVPDDIERGVLYDKTVEDILTSTKEKMEVYTHSMRQPSMYLFYIAILLPLMIIIMLPVAAAFAGIPIASVPVLITLYIVVLPLITYIYAGTILSKRPGGYIPPEIPDDHPELPPPGTARIRGMKLPIIPITVGLVILLLGSGIFIETAMQLSPEEAAIQEALSGGKEVRQPHVIQYFVPLAIAIPLGFYLFAKSYNKRKIQEEIVKMEGEFKDAMYLMASRLGEKKPVEDALSYVKRFMPESKVATEVLEDIQRNIMVLGLTLRSAIFDSTYGAMKNIPSRLMKSSFKIMTDSIELGPEVASVSLVSVSNQIRNIEKIKDLMRKLLDDVTGMMGSMATFIAPIVLGIVASLQQIIVNVVKPLSQQGNVLTESHSTGTIAGVNTGVGGGGALIEKGAIESMAGPIEFQIIVALYIIELVIILSYFVGKVRYGENKTAIMMTIGRTLPIAISVFIGALYLGASMIGGMAG